MTNPSLIDFLRSYREPVLLGAVCCELEKLGAHGADWPKASADHWRRELLKLVADERLVLDGEYVRVPIMEDRPKQRELF